MTSMALGTGGQERISATPWLPCGWTGNAGTMIPGVIPGHWGSAKQTHNVPVVRFASTISLKPPAVPRPSTAGAPKTFSRASGISR
jgi:hypothetical protein